MQQMGGTFEINNNPSTDPLSYTLNQNFTEYTVTSVEICFGQKSML
jgi:hypothetical protein